jgi:hypothetical protein
MTDWATVSALATAGGTLVLAAATFASVRSSNNAAQAMERSLLANIRPVLMPSRPQDPMTKIGFHDDHWLKVEGGRAGVEVTDDAIYLGIPMRNVGNGLAVLDRWDFYAERITGGEATHRTPEEFRRLTRDLYVPAGDVGFWQGAFREPSGEIFREARDAIEGRDTLTIDVLYGDHEGGQRTITRFALLPMPDGGWLAIVGRHWNLDRADPR